MEGGARRSRAPRSQRRTAFLAAPRSCSRLWMRAQTAMIYPATAPRRVMRAPPGGIGGWGALGASARRDRRTAGSRKPVVLSSLTLARQRDPFLRARPASASKAVPSNMSPAGSGTGTAPSRTTGPCVVPMTGPASVWMLKLTVPSVSTDESTTRVPNVAGPPSV